MDRHTSSSQTSILTNWLKLKSLDVVQIYIHTQKFLESKLNSLFNLFIGWFLCCLCVIFVLLCYCYSFTIFSTSHIVQEQKKTWLTNTSRVCVWQHHNKRKRQHTFVQKKTYWNFALRFIILIQVSSFNTFIFLWNCFSVYYLGVKLIVLPSNIHHLHYAFLFLPRNDRHPFMCVGKSTFINTKTKLFSFSTTYKRILHNTLWNHLHITIKEMTTKFICFYVYTA